MDPGTSQERAQFNITRITHSAECNWQVALCGHLNPCLMSSRRCDGLRLCRPVSPTCVLTGIFCLFPSASKSPLWGHNPCVACADVPEALEHLAVAVRVYTCPACPCCRFLDRCSTSVYARPPIEVSCFHGYGCGRTLSLSWMTRISTVAFDGHPKHSAPPTQHRLRVDCC